MNEKNTITPLYLTERATTDNSLKKVRHFF
jgi:hypothetical protein